MRDHPRPHFATRREQLQRPVQGLGEQLRYRGDEQTAAVPLAPPEAPQAVKHKPVPQPKAARELSLSFRVPRIRAPKVKVPIAKLAGMRKLLARRVVWLPALGLVVLGAGAFTAISLFDGEPAAGRQGTSGVLGGQSDDKPPYDTILPKGKDIAALGGWGRVSPPDKEPVYAFVDRIGDVQLNVSEQPLPESFAKDEAGNVAKLAEQFAANQKLAVDGFVAYLGTSGKGPQSVVMAKDGLLVLIKSATKVSNTQWIEYLNNLQ